MKEIVKLLKKNLITIPEYEFLVFRKDGLIAYNGKAAIRYNPKCVGDILMSIVEKYGDFVVTDASFFLKTIRILQTTAEIDGINMDKKESALVFNYNNGNSSIKVPILVNYDVEDIPHFNIEWKDLDDKKDADVYIKPNKVLAETPRLLQKTGNFLFSDDELGLFAHNGYYITCDVSAYSISEKVLDDKISFFIPLEILDLGFSKFDWIVVGEDHIVLMNSSVQCYINNYDIKPRETSLINKFNSATKYKTTLFDVLSVWKRSKLFSLKSIINLEIKDGNIRIFADAWSEKIGTTEAPDGLFIIPEHLVSRWARVVTDHVIAVNDDRDVFISGKSKLGEFTFYGSLKEDITEAEKRLDSENNDSGTVDSIEDMDILSEENPLLK